MTIVGSRPAATDVRREIELPLIGGESPVWDERLQRLYFVDMQAAALFRLDPATGALERWTMPATIGSCGLCRDGRVLVALRTGVFRFSPEHQRFEFLAHPERDRPQNRLNDGKVSPEGRFWIGSMNEEDPRRPVAGLFRIDPDGTCTRMLDGLLTSNGLAWSPDGRRMIHSDSRGQYLQAFDYDPATGTIANGRRLRNFTEAEGRPDGAAMDSEGFYWSAGVSAGCLNRLAPDGTIVESVALSVAAPSMPCFGGPDMKTLFVASLSTGAGGPGGLISFRTRVAGVPVGLF